MTVRTCLCLITRDTTEQGAQVLLGFKKTGFGAGRWVGIGGHVEDGEEPAAAAVRELAEETGLIADPASLSHLASLDFRFPARPAWDQTAEVYLTAEFEGDPAESDEVIPRWFPFAGLPLDGMWDDARYWLPLVLSGQPVRVRVTFADDCATVALTDPPLRPAVPAAPGADQAMTIRITAAGP